MLQLLIYVPAVAVDWFLSSFVSNRPDALGDPLTWLTLAGLVVGYLPLVVRRRWTMTAFGFAWFITLLITITGYGQPFLGALVALHAVAALRPLGMAQVALLLAILPGLAQSWWTADYVSGHAPTFEHFAIPVLFFTGLTFVVWLIGRHEHRNRLSAQALRRQLAESSAAATDLERRRIAHELHDILSHSVSAMMMQAAGARALSRTLVREHGDEPRLTTVEEALDTIERTGSESLRELHRLLAVLRDGEQRRDASGTRTAPVPDQREDEDPEHHDVHALVEGAVRSGLAVEHHHVGEHRRLDPSVASTLYRVVQESLTNAIKHGGTGAVVTVHETWADDAVRVQVRARRGHDAGEGPTAPGSGTGLIGLQERVELVGGRFESGWIGEEFVTTADLPLTDRARRMDERSLTFGEEW